MKVFSARDVAQLLGISIRQVYGHARAGFLQPARGKHRAYRFSFQDLVLLRTARALALARIPAQRVRRALRRLVRDLPRGRRLSEVRITAENGKVVVRDGASAWNPESGQLQLDFRTAPLAKRATPIARRKVKELRSADDHLDLGRSLYEQNEVADAAAEYRKALAMKHNHHAEAAYNLGIALEDLGETNDAIVAYRRAIEADPFFAEAHRSLAELYQKSGKKGAARRHLATYRELKKARR